MTAHRPGGVVPQARAERFRVGAAMLVSLLAGRSSYRLVVLATTVLLLPIWGEERYRGYAAAIASFSWLLALVFTGPEKTVLKLLPRAPRTGRMVTDALVAVLWWLPLPLVAGYLLALAAGSGRTALSLGVASMLLSIGCTHLLVGLHRARGQPRIDVASFLAMTVVELGLLAAAAVGLLGPVGFVGAVTAVQLGINLALAVRLGSPSLRIRRRPRLLRRLGWTALFLGGADLFVLVTTAVLVNLLAGSAAHAGQLSRFYVVLLIWSAGVNLLLYLFRVYAPHTALRLAGRAGWAGRVRARRLAGLAAVADATWLLVAGSVLAATGLATPATATGEVLVWSVLLLTKAPALATLLWASFVLENTDATAPRLVAAAAVTGLLAATAAGLVAVPAWGAAGVLVALTAGELGYVAVAATGGRAARLGRSRAAAVATLR